MSIEITHLSKRFGTFAAVEDVTLRVETGELVGLLGPSGSGKTTLLRLIAGQDVPDAGSITIGGVDATSQSVRQRQIGFVFQHYALFRHMSVFENVAFGLRAPSGRPTPRSAVARTSCSNLDFRARVVHINKAGPIVKVELVAEWGDRVFVEMSPERCLSLNLDTDAEVFISPRDKRLFVRG